MGPLLLNQILVSFRAENPKANLTVRDKSKIFEAKHFFLLYISLCLLSIKSIY